MSVGAKGKHYHEALVGRALEMGGAAFIENQQFEISATAEIHDPEG